MVGAPVTSGQERQSGMAKIRVLEIRIDAAVKARRFAVKAERAALDLQITAMANELGALYQAARS